MLIAFIESKNFTRKVRKQWTAKACEELKIDLSDNPDLGDIIVGGDGIRKLRRRITGRGKSGGVRVIYFWAVSRDTILLLDIYPKSQKADLSDRELKQLIKLKDLTLADLT